MSSDARLVLVVDGSPDVQQAVVQPIELAGLQSAVVASVPAALGALGRLRPALTLVNADAASLDHPAALESLKALRAHRSQLNVPLIFLTSMRTPAETLELGARAGIDDCILGPLRLAHLQARTAALEGRHEAIARPHFVVAIDGDARREQALMEGLRASGTLLFSADAVGAAVAAMNVNTTAPLAILLAAGETRPQLEALRAAQALKAPVVVLSALPAPAPLPAGVRRWLPAHSAPATIVEALVGTTVRQRPQAGTADRVPFHALLEFRDAESPTARWTSGFSSWLCPKGVWAHTLLPPRQGAAVDLRICLTTTGEVLEGTCVVSLSNPFPPARVHAVPTGAEFDFLGMSPTRLGRLRQLCEALGATSEERRAS